MDRHPPSAAVPLPFLLAFVLFLSSACLVSPASDYITTLVYRGCATQSFVDPSGAYSQALAVLFGSLVSQSTKSRFYKTSSSTAQTSITGLFQCRGDLSPSDCYNCVSRLPVLSDELCGRTIASRVQLYGCYMLYQVAGFPDVSGMEMLYKTCGGSNVVGTGFEDRRDTAFLVLENGVVTGHGFYAGSYESVYVLGQCEGDIGDSDCGECVKGAIQKAQVECGSAINGQVYLQKCFISYSYYPDGVPQRQTSLPSSSTPSSESSHGGGNMGSGSNTGKTAAIMLGGAAGVGFLVICLLFSKGLLKKRDDF